MKISAVNVAVLLCQMATSHESPLPRSEDYKKAVISWLAERLAGLQLLS